jgi:uncharacterized membrane protein
LDRLVDFYPWLKALHIFLGMVAVGFNVSYGIWQTRAAREPQHMGYALRGIKFLDDRVANPAYVGLALVGVVLILIGPYDFADLWVAVAIGLYVLLMAIGLAAYSPTLKRQIAVYESAGPDAPEFAALGNRGRMLGILLGVIVVAIILLMVLKPGG